jgi:hypothetical protein
MGKTYNDPNKQKVPPMKKEDITMIFGAIGVLGTIIYRWVGKLLSDKAAIIEVTVACKAHKESIDELKKKIELLEEKISEKMDKE